MSAVIIAEIGTSHEGNMAKAKELVKASCEAGADCIKFQWVYADEILHPKTGFVDLPTGRIPLYERFKQLEVQPQFFKELQDFVHKYDKKFMCSPFGKRSLEELFAQNPDYIKIASPELNHFPMLERLVELELLLPEHKRIPVVISSGVSTIQDIKKALEILLPLKKQNLVTLLHCVTSYPAPPEDYNLLVLEYLQNELKINVGVSDHSLDPVLVPNLSIACGGTMVEKHITLSTQTDGLDDPIALNPQYFEKMVSSIRKCEKLPKNAIITHLQEDYDPTLIKNTLGTGKKELAESEKSNYGRTNRSIHFMRDMYKGEVITEHDIAVLRTEKILTVGLSPEHYKSVIGKTLQQDVIDGDGMTFEMVLAKK